jgi:LPXTG-motif cell wall-anchored protein
MAVATLMAIFALLPVAGAAPRAAETKTVNKKDFKLAPQTITLNVGDSITWENGDTVEHTATADDGSFNTDDVEAGEDKTIVFNNAGTFAYYCKYHGGPGGKGMSGTITVQAAAQPQPTTAPAPAGAEVTGSLEVTDQPVVNGSITVAKATISQDGWVVVHKAGPDGKLLLTPVIGQTQIKAGDNANVVIKLTEDVAPGAPLWPMIHVDLGQKGTYEFPNGPDVPATGDKATVQIKVAEAAGGTNGPAGGAPSQLPRTGGEDGPSALLALALVVLMAGTLLALRSRRRGM